MNSWSIWVRSKRLKKLRYSPRISAEGNVMKLLSEEEEDVYLDESATTPAWVYADA